MTCPMAMGESSIKKGPSIKAVCLIASIMAKVSSAKAMATNLRAHLNTVNSPVKALAGWQMDLHMLDFGKTVFGMVKENSRTKMEQFSKENGSMAF